MILPLTKTMKPARVGRDPPLFTVITSLLAPSLLGDEDEPSWILIDEMMSLAWVFLTVKGTPSKVGGVGGMCFIGGWVAG